MAKEAIKLNHNRPVYPILSRISGSHLLNDMIQSVIVAIYPLLQGNFSLTFAQIGLITFGNQITASLLQPLIGYYTDKFPKPYSLPIGMGFTFSGLIMLTYATSFNMILIAASLAGVGSAVFHPESSRVARMASGGRLGMAQSFFQVGGYVGHAMGPLIAAFIITPYGQGNIAWLSLAALTAIIVLLQVSKWYKLQCIVQKSSPDSATNIQTKINPNVLLSIIILLILVFSKAFYSASFGSYYIFYLIEKFHISQRDAQFYLFIFLFSIALGTLIGGPLGDKIGRIKVIWLSIVGAAPFALMLPYASLFWSAILTILIGLIFSSAFSAILVYAQELIPNKVGTIAGLFFGFSFGMAGLGAAVLGKIADMTSIFYVYQICSYLPLLGFFAILLPKKSLADHG